MFAEILGTALNAGILIVEGAANYNLDLSSIDLSPMVQMFQSAVPSILTACIPLIGIRKVIGLLFGTIKGA